MSRRQRPADDRLAVLVISQPSSVWGAQLRLMDLAPALRERGVELTLAGPPSGDLRERWEHRGLPYLPVELPVHAGLRRPGTDHRAPPRQLATEAVATARAIPQIRRLARDFDVVLSFSLPSHLETAIGARLARRPVVIEIVDIVRPGLGRRILRLASRIASATVVNSRATAAALEGDADRAIVIHPGVDVVRYHPGASDEAVRTALGGRPGRALVGIVGRVDPGKGIDVLIDAMVTDAGPVADADLVVVGDAAIAEPSWLASLHERSRALGDRVTFAGRRDDVPQVMRCLDVFVNASSAEPFGRSVLEAQASGVAVVCTDAGGIPEFVEHDVNGLLVAPDDPAALRAALARVLADADLRARLAATARQRAEDSYDLTTRYDLAAAVYRRVVGHVTGAGSRDGTIDGPAIRP